MIESEWKRFYEFCSFCKPGKEVKIGGDRLVAIAKECQEAGMGGLALCQEYEGEFSVPTSGQDHIADASKMVKGES